MGPVEVVLNQPFRQIMVKSVHVCGGISRIYELLLERAVESLADGVVLGRFHPAPPVGEPHVLDRSVKIQVELAAIVGLDMNKLSNDQLIKLEKKIRSTE